MLVEKYVMGVWNDIVLTLPQRLTHIGRTLVSNSTLRKGYSTLADQAVVSAANFLTGIIIGRACGKEEFGLYILGLSIVMFMLNAQMSLISSPYTVYSIRLKDVAHSIYTGSTLVHQLILSILAIISLVVIRFVLSLGIGQRGLEDIISVLIAVITFILLREFARRVCLANFDIKRALFVDLFVVIVQFGGLLLLAHYGVLTSSRVFLVIGAACVLSSVSWLISERKNITPNIKKAMLDLSQNWSFGKWVFASGIVWWGSMELYPWLLATFYGTESTGTLAACMGIIYLVNPFLLGIGNFLAPKTARAFANGGVNELRLVVIKSTILIAVALGIFCVVIFIFGEVILIQIYGNEYSGTGFVMGILALSQLISALTFPLNHGLLAMERPDVGCKSYLLAFGVTLTLGLWLVKSFGLTGLAFGLLASNLMASAIRTVFFIKYINDLPVQKNGHFGRTNGILV